MGNETTYSDDNNGVPIIQIRERQREVYISGDFFVPYPDLRMKEPVCSIRDWMGESDKQISLHICLRDFNTSVARQLIEAMTELADWGAEATNRTALICWYYCESDINPQSEDGDFADNNETASDITFVELPKVIWDMRIRGVWE